MKYWVPIVVIATLSPVALGVETIVFDTPSGEWSMEMVVVGSPGNLPDTPDSRGNELGRVDYAYRIGKFELDCGLAGAIHERRICTDSLDWPAPGSDGTLAAVANRMNELYGYPAAYRIGTAGQIQDWPEDINGFDPQNPKRNSLARFAIPTADEFYKAAFYDPQEAGYYRYANSSNVTPISSSTPTTIQSEVLCCGVSQRHSVFATGGLSPSGTMGQSGGVAEFVESGGAFVGSGSAVRGQVKDSKESYNPLFVLSSGGRLVFLFGPDDPRPGDVNADGKVDFTDFLKLSSNFGDVGSRDQGDLDLDGIVGFSDFLLLSDNYDRVFGAVSSVPEPGAHLILCVGVMLLLNFRGRRDTVA